jgi:hypothetical protein
MGDAPKLVFSSHDVSRAFGGGLWSLKKPDVDDDAATWAGHSARAASVAPRWLNGVVGGRAANDDVALAGETGGDGARASP